MVERAPYNAIYQQRDPVTGKKLGRSRGNYLKLADHLARLQAAEPHATAERLIELERKAQTTRQPATYTDVTVSLSKSISVLHASNRETGDARDWPATNTRRLHPAMTSSANQLGGKVPSCPILASISAHTGANCWNRLRLSATRRARRAARAGRSRGVGQ